MLAVDHLVLRRDTPPVDQHDLDDRRDTRATSNEEMLKRYMELERHRIKCDWHRTLQRLTTIAVLMTLYIVAVVALLRSVPQITVQQAMMIAGAAIASSAGGYLANQALKRYRQRRSRDGSPP
jgi:hypothetical protein